MTNRHSHPMLDLTQCDAAIFDLDGVVTKTARVHAAAWKNLFDRYLQKRASQTGESFLAFDLNKDYREYVDGKPRYDGVSSFLTSRGIHLPQGDPSDSTDHDSVCGLGNRKNAMFLEALQTHGVEVFPSTLALIHLLKARGKKIAVVTASENCQAILQASGTTDLFDVTVDGRDARTSHLQGKPHPDTFVKAAELLGVKPPCAVVFEDALAGVEAGHAGHFGLVVGIDRAEQAKALRSHGGDVVVSDIVELRVCDEQGREWSSAPALPSAMLQCEEIFSRFDSKRPIIFLDYDGTLTPIVDRPELATLSPAMREVLGSLSRQCPVGIISGRDRQDVSALVNLDSLIVAGSHGFDIAGPQDLTLQHEVGTQYSSTLNQAEQTLRNRLRPISGSFVERKKFSIAIHYRLVAPESVPRLEHEVFQILSDFPDLRRTEGKKVIEIQPRIQWDKGKALLWLLDSLKWKAHNHYPLYIGDDLTDEDAFGAVRQIGVGIVVEEGYRFSSAQYALNDTNEVHHFLAQLHAHLEHSRA